MSGKLISLIYFYLISAAALALIVIGIFNIVNFSINTTQYDKYPLRYQPFDCERYPGKFGIDAPVPATSMVPPASPSAQELELQQEKCEQQLEEERKKQRLDDLKSAVTFTAVGTILFLIHFPMARKHSK